MRSIRTLIVTGCIVTLVFVLAACSKTQKSEDLGKIGDVTYSKNFNSQLTEANIWMEPTLVFHDVRTKWDIVDKEELVEATWTNFLRNNEHETHQIYFKWVEVSLQPLEFKVTAYLTPAPKKVKSGTQMIEGGTDPPGTTTPPPPL
jgi:hypothetical protein